MQLELISFKLCPYVQASAIILQYRNIEHKVTYIDINDPPLWFLELSPTGQVPVLKVDDTVVFESAVIGEYLNDISGGDMMPADPLQRATNRAWIQFCNSMYGDVYNLIGAGDQESAEDIIDDLQEKLDRVENSRGEGRYFNGDSLNLIDFSFAVLFMRLDLLHASVVILDAERFPRLSAWSDELLGLDCVRNSVVDGFAGMFHGMMKMRGGHVGQLL